MNRVLEHLVSITIGGAVVAIGTSMNAIDPSDEVRTRSFVLVDRENRERMTAKALGGMVQIRVLDQGGEPLAELNCIDFQQVAALSLGKNDRGQALMFGANGRAFFGAFGADQRDLEFESGNKVQRIRSKTNDRTVKTIDLTKK